VIGRPKARTAMERESQLEEEERRDRVNRLLSSVTLLRMRGDLKGALERCGEALKVDPSSSFALEAQGDLLSELGNHQEAQEAYRLALQASPGRVDLEEKIGLAALRLSDKEELSQVQEELAAEAGAHRQKRKTVPGAVIWSTLLCGGGHIYLGDYYRGFVLFSIFLIALLYVLAGFLTAYHNTGRLGAILWELRTHPAGTRVAFSMAAALLVAVYLYSILDALRKARGMLLLPFRPQAGPPHDPGAPPSA